MRNPSFTQGFARCKSESEYPHLWDGLQFAGSPILGPTGRVLYDIAGRGRNGSITNAAWFTNGRGVALDFAGGAADRIDIGTFSVISPTMTMALWVYYDSFSNTRDDRWISKADGTGVVNHDWMIGIAGGASPKMRCRFNRAASATLVGATTLTTSNWFHAAATFSSIGASANTATAQLFLNGISDGTSSTFPNGDLPNNADLVMIGNQPTALTNSPDAKLYDIFIWDRVLTQPELLQLALLRASPLIYRRKTRFPGTAFVGGGGTDVTVNVTGAEIVLESNSVAVAGGATVAAVGSEVAVESGTAAAIGGATVGVTGSEVLVESSSVAVAGGAIVGVSGSEVAGESNSVTPAGGATVGVTGSEVLVEGGVVTADAATIVEVTGAEISLESNSVAVAGGAIVGVSGSEVAVESGAVTPTGGALVGVLGSEIAVDKNAVTVAGGATVGVTGGEVLLEGGLVAVFGHATVLVLGNEVLIQGGVVTVGLPTPRPEIHLLRPSPRAVSSAKIPQGRSSVGIPGGTTSIEIPGSTSSTRIPGATSSDFTT